MAHTHDVHTISPYSHIRDMCDKWWSYHVGVKYVCVGVGVCGWVCGCVCGCVCVWVCIDVWVRLLSH